MPDEKDIYRSGSDPQPRRRRRKKRRSSSRHLPRGPTPSPVERFAWIVLLVVLFGYLAVLGVVKGQRFLRKRAAARPVAAAPTVPEPPPAESSTGFAVNASELTGWIEKWERAERTVREVGALRKDPLRAPELEKRLRRDLEGAPEVLETKAELARLLQLQGRHDEACTAAFEVLQANSKDAGVALLLAQSLTELKLHEEALVVAQWVIERDSLSTEGHRIAYRGCLATGRPSQAIKHIEKLLMVEPENQALLNQMALAYSQLGQHGRGIEVLLGALKKDPNNPVGMFNLATLYARSAKPEEAVDTLSDAARELGYPFIATWLDSPEFDPIREEESFRKFKDVTTELIGKEPEASEGEPPPESAPSDGTVP